METKGQWGKKCQKKKKKTCQLKIKYLVNVTCKKLRQSKKHPKINKNKPFVVKLNKIVKDVQLILQQWGFRFFKLLNTKEGRKESEMNNVCTGQTENKH